MYAHQFIPTSTPPPSTRKRASEEDSDAGTCEDEGVVYPIHTCVHARTHAHLDINFLRSSAVSARVRMRTAAASQGGGESERVGGWAGEDGSSPPRALDYTCDGAKTQPKTALDEGEDEEKMYANLISINAHPLHLRLHSHPRLRASPASSICIVIRSPSIGARDARDVNGSRCAPSRACGGRNDLHFLHGKRTPTKAKREGSPKKRPPRELQERGEPQKGSAQSIPS
ncbi:hypothetical protein B0H13DRAFT_2460372 [Mycena leptocephala]|nr:hypothetical protein B0H13DRAFT_2460372 [Mycena leptocephala]